jgi:hypothetical protein
MLAVSGSNGCPTGNGCRHTAPHTTPHSNGCPAGNTASTLHLTLPHTLRLTLPHTALSQPGHHHEACSTHV